MILTEHPIRDQPVCLPLLLTCQSAVCKFEYCLKSGLKENVNRRLDVDVDRIDVDAFTDLEQLTQRNSWMLKYCMSLI